MRLVMYQLKVNNPRVQKRILKALTFVSKYVTSKPNWLSTRWIYHKDHFGIGSNSLSKYLGEQLLICVDEHYSMDRGICKQYIRNEIGYKHLKELLADKPATIATTEQLQLDTGKFLYESKSNRLFNPIQNYPSIIKRPLLARNGYNYNYDIQCCAPRLLLQYSRKCGLDTPTPLLDSYIDNRKQIRTEISDALGITSDQVKQIINALLNGAVISHRTDTSILNILDNKHQLIDQLKSNRYITELRVEIKSMWCAIKPHRLQRTITDVRGRTRALPLSTKEKSITYRELEEIVLREIAKYLGRTNNQALLEHDGWTSREVIDITELRSYVKSHTGYLIEIDWEIYE